MELKEGTYTIPDNLRMQLLKGGKTLVVTQRKGINPHLKEGEYRCKDCTHFVTGYWSKNIRWYSSKVCDQKPKKQEGCFYACHYYGKPCSKFELKPK